MNEQSFHLQTDVFPLIVPCFFFSFTPYISPPSPLICLHFHSFLFNSSSSQTPFSSPFPSPISLPSLLLQPHLAADNLELIRDEDRNNLLHISASQGHADCLQHLTSLMGEDGLNERNNQQLTPAGLGVKVSECEFRHITVCGTTKVTCLTCNRDLGCLNSSRSS